MPLKGGTPNRGMGTNLNTILAARVMNISKSFGVTTVLDDVTFDVNEGEIIVLLGASGSGKTTILRIIAGLESPDSGSVILHGKDVTELPARLRGTGVIFQAYALFPKMNVEENIGYGLRLRKKSKSEIKTAVDRLVEMVHLEDHRRKFPSQLSGGQQQRVAIARALAYEPEVLLFDEPFGALDAQIRTTLRREIRALLKQINVPSIFITHDQEEALELGDRIAVLNAGRMEQIGTPYEVYNKPETEHVATFLGSANLLPGVIRGGRFTAGDISLEIEDEVNFKEGAPVTL
ncbi:MAG: ABC transporter ATP-binding protein, partial [Pyrinomonadaceae bacterium]